MVQIVSQSVRINLSWQPQLVMSLSDEDRDNILKTGWISSCQETRHGEGGKLGAVINNFCFLTFQWDLPLL